MSTGGTALDSSTLPVSNTQDTALSGWCAERVPASDTLHEMRRRLAWIIGAIALAAIVFVGLRQAPESKAPSEPKVSKISPAELHAKLDGAPPALAALHAQANDLLPGARKSVPRAARGAGHPVVVNVWAAWCVPCRVELPVIQRASLDYGKRVAFVGVDLADNRGAARSCCATSRSPTPPTRTPTARSPRASASWARRARSTTTRGQADLHPSGPVPRSRAARRGHQALRGLVTEVRPARDQPEVDAALALRYDVFCVEQGVSLEEELDGLDDDALHLVVSTTARLSAPAACWPTAARSSSGGWPWRPPPRPRPGRRAADRGRRPGARAATRSASCSPPSSPPGRSTRAPDTPVRRRVPRRRDRARDDGQGAGVGALQVGRPRRACAAARRLRPHRGEGSRRRSARSRPRRRAGP